MKKKMKTHLSIVLSSLVTLSVLAGTASATAPFKKAFDQAYVKKSDSDEFKSAFKKSGCYTCHVKGKKKDWLNLYGQEIAKLIDGNAKQRVDEAKKKGSGERKAEVAKIKKELELAFTKVGKVKSPSGVVYEELFKSHKLPTPEGAKSLKEKAKNEQEPIVDKAD
jgi:hypothetical protein